MLKKSPDDILGLEFDWLAVDADGAVGFFSTAGGGYAPEELLDDTDAYDRAIAALLALPMTTRANCNLIMRPELQNTWLMMAERGIFAFDSDPAGGPYQRIATPEASIQIAQLPRVAAEVVQRVQFRQVRFVELNQISAELLKRK